MNSQEASKVLPDPPRSLLTPCRLFCSPHSQHAKVLHCSGFSLLMIPDDYCAVLYCTGLDCSVLDPGVLCISLSAPHLHTPPTADVRSPSLQQTERLVVRLVWHTFTRVLSSLPPPPIYPSPAPSPCPLTFNTYCRPVGQAPEQGQC